MAMNIYLLTHAVKTPNIAAVPDPDRFCSEVLGNLGNLDRDAPIPQFQMLNPALKSQGFFNVSDSVLVFTRDIYLGPLGAALELAGNVHRTTLTDTGESVYMLNVTACYNCIDRSRTVFYAPNGKEEAGVDYGMGIKTPAYFPKLIGDSWIFRVPQMPYAIFVASDGRGGADDFYTSYQNEGTTELVFKQIWADERVVTSREWLPSESPIVSGIQIVTAGITATTSGDNLAYVQVSSEAKPNPNPKFDTYGVVPSARALAVRDMLVQVAAKAPGFPSVLIVSSERDDSHELEAMIIGKHLRGEVACALLANLRLLGIKRVFLSPLHHEFIIAPKKAMMNWYPEISDSIDEHLQAFAG